MMNDKSKKNKPDYFHTIMMIERFYRLFLKEITTYLNGLKIKDITYVQCLILYNVYDRHVSIGQLMTLEYYLGANVNYNVKQLIKNGYILSEINEHDRRTTYISLSKKGFTLYKKLHDYFVMKTNALELYEVENEDLGQPADINYIFDKFLHLTKIEIKKNG